MNMLDRFLGHDLDTTRDLLNLCLDLCDEEMDRPIELGLGSIRLTLEHMIRNIEVWTDMMMARPARPASGPASAEALLARLEQGYAEFAAFARRIEAEGRLDALWTDSFDEPATQKSFGGAIGHVITHNMHHRAELLAMLRRLGVGELPEGDLMGWDQRTRLT